jgi:DNA-binding NtrC family response regulator
MKMPRTQTRTGSLSALLRAYERDLILTTLAATKGHQRRAAANLGLLPSTLSEKMKRLGIRPSRAEAAQAQIQAALEAARADQDNI